MEHLFLSNHGIVDHRVVILSGLDARYARGEQVLPLSAGFIKCEAAKTQQCSHLCPSSRHRAATGRVRSQQDVCANAVEVASLPFSETGSTVDAVPGFSNAACDVADDAPGVWYEYTPSGTEVIKLTVDLPPLSFIGLSMSVYIGTCDNLTCLDKTDYKPPDLGKSLTWIAGAGTTYYIRITSVDTVKVGPFQIDLEVSKARGTMHLTVPVFGYRLFRISYVRSILRSSFVFFSQLLKVPNYDCAEATEVAALPFSAQDTTEGSDDLDFSDTDCYDAMGSPGVWFKFNPSENQVNVVKIDTGGVLSNIIRVGISVFSGTCGGLNCEAGTQFYSTSLLSIPWAASAGTTYYIRISSEDSGEVGPFQINIEVRLVFVKAERHDPI